MRTPRVLIITAVLSFAAPAAASAAYFQSAPIDASPGIQRIGDLDIAHDGGGIVAYVRQDGGADHIFVSRLVNGSFLPPERVDASLAGAGEAPAVAASDGGRVTVVFVSGGAVYAVTRQANGSAFTQPQLLAPAGSSPSVDMSINGVGYATFTAAGDIRVARVDRNATQYSTFPTPLDAVGANDAGAGAGRSHVATSADGSAIAVWGESGRVYARRIYSDHVASAAIDLTADQLDGHAGGAADSPWVDIEDDSSFAWVVYREAFADGRMHTVARRIEGSIPAAPTAVDGLGYGGDNAATARVEINGRGEGVTTSGSSGFAAFAALIHDDHTFGAARVSGANAVSPQPVGAESENNNVFVSWFQGTPVAATVHTVSYDVSLADRGVPGPASDTQLSADPFGRADATAGLDLDVDRVGDMAVVFVQDDGVTRRLVAAGFDRPPGAFNTRSLAGWRRYTKPLLAWSPSLDLWGINYDVQIDAKSVAKTAATSVTVPVRLAEGVHQWQVVGTDAHGQQVVSPSRTLRVDSIPPAVSFSIKRRGRKAKVIAKVADGSLTAPSGSGVVRVSIAFGDGFVASRRSVTHTYRRGGAFNVRVTATDKAGNKGSRTRRVRIKK